MDLPIPERIIPSVVAQLTPTYSLGTHSTFITAAAYHPNGALFATADGNGDVKVWDPKSGVLIAEENNLRAGVTQLRFAAQTNPATLLIAHDNNTLSIVALEDSFLEVKQTTHLPNPPIFDIAFIEGNQPIAVVTRRNQTDEKYLTLIDLSTAETLQRLPVAEAEVACACISSDGALIAWANSEGTVTIFPRNGKPATTITVPVTDIKHVMFNATQSHITVMEATGDHIAVIDLKTQQVVGLPVLTLFADQFALNNDGSVLIVSTRQHRASLLMIDTATGDVLQTARGGTPVAFSALGNSFVAGSNYAHTSKRISVWDSNVPPDGIFQKADAAIQPENAEIISSLAVLTGHRDAVLDLAFSPDGLYLATASTDKSIRLWNMKTGTESNLLRHHKAEITSVTYSPDGLLLISGGGYFMNEDDKAVRIYDVSTDKEIIVFDKHRARIIGINVHPDGKRIVSGDHNGQIYIWNAETGTVELSISQKATLNAIALSNDGTLLAAAYGGSTMPQDNSVRIFNVDTGELVNEFKAFTDWAISVAFHQSEPLLMANDYSNRLCTWNLDTGEKVLDVLGGANALFHPNQALLVVIQDKLVKLYDTSAHTLFTRLRCGSNIKSATFNPQGTLLATGLKDGTVVIWGVDKDKKVSPRAQTATATENERLATVMSNRHTIQLKTLKCTRGQERDGDEVYLKFDGQTMWMVEQAGFKMNHNLGRHNHIDVFDFVTCKGHNKKGWRDASNYDVEDFRFEGLTGPVKLELWEEDNFLRGGDDFFGEVTVTPEQAGQGEIEAVFYSDGATYVLTYEVTLQS